MMTLKVPITAKILILQGNDDVRQRTGLNSKSL